MEGLINYGIENRPWGNFEQFTLNEKSTIKILTVNAGEELSLQVHTQRDEFGRVLKGSGTIQIGEKNIDVNGGDSFFIPRNTKHRATSGSEGLVYLEISFGDFDENDETRIEDEYGRV
jgi:mannose-1-phosphate guanylyltransferase/mannose-6-phosphate isomerase